MTVMDDAVGVVCPFCGEPSTISAGAEDGDDEFVQDCPICCRPWQVRVKVRRDGSLDVTISPEGG